MAPRILLCCLVLGLAGCGEEAASDDGSAPGKPAPVTELTVRVDPDGKGPEPAKQARDLLRCGRQGRGLRGCGGPAPGRLRADPRRRRLHGAVRRPADREGLRDRSTASAIDGDLRPQRRLRDRPLGQARRAAGAGGLMAYRVVLRHGPKVAKHDAETLAAALDLLEHEARAVAGGPRRQDRRPARADLRAGAAGRGARGAARGRRARGRRRPRRRLRRGLDRPHPPHADRAPRRRGRLRGAAPRAGVRARASSRSGAASRRAPASRARATPAAPRSAASGPSPRGGRPRARSRSRARPRAPAAGAS